MLSTISKKRAYPAMVEEKTTNVFTRRKLSHPPDKKPCGDGISVRSS